MNENSGDIRPKYMRVNEVDGEGASVIEVDGKEGIEGECVIGEDVQQGERKPVKMNDPVEPSAEERKEHEITHLPYRNWCRHCVRGRGKEAPHEKKKGGVDGELNELHFKR